MVGGGPRVVVSTAAFHARVRGSSPGLCDLKETEMFFPHPLVIVGCLRDRDVACSASDLQGLNWDSCVWRAVSSHWSLYPQEVIFAQFKSLYVQKKPLSFYFNCKYGDLVLFVRLKQNCYFYYQTNCLNSSRYVVSSMQSLAWPRSDEIHQVMNVHYVH